MVETREAEQDLYLFIYGMEWSGMGVPVTYVRVALT